MFHLTYDSALITDSKTLVTLKIQDDDCNATKINDVYYFNAILRNGHNYTNIIMIIMYAH